ncbi:GLPGLI family protein [Tenacibaculum salmonis]|uniref:GLPGLI family protein n=1 Tax=Tenacibaculum sp. P3-BQ1 TaxID=3232310 RepID=UPI0034DDF356
MVKFQLILILCLIPIIGVSQSKNYRITYKEILKERRIKNEFKAYMKDFPNFNQIKDSITSPASTSLAVLEGNSKKAMYFVPSMNISKTKKGNINEENGKSEILIIKDFVSKTQFYQTKSNQYPDLPTRVLKRKINFIDWKITHERKNINGFNCRKAIGSNDDEKIICWFTDDFGIIGAPNSYDGLPGLAVFIEVLNQFKTYQLVSLDYPKTIKFKTLDKKYELITEEEFRNPKPFIIERKGRSLH